MKRLPLLLRMLRRRSRSGTPALYEVAYETGLSVPAADGTTMRADHYAPVTDEPCPTVLIRSPYGFGFPWNYIYGARYAEQGFQVVIAATRSYVSFGSHEIDDSVAAVAWLREQSWFDGRLGTVGASYLAYTQWALAHEPPPEWQAAVFQVSAHKPVFWSGGGFALELALVGGLGLFSQSGRLWTYATAILRLQRHLNQVLRTVPLIDGYVKAFGGRRTTFEDWLTHPADDLYWEGVDLGGAADRLAVPASLATGWWDLTLDQTLQQYARLRAAGRDPDLLIGPWTHTSALEDGAGELNAQAFRRLRGQEPEHRVRVHLGGADEWRHFTQWPPGGTTELRLHLGSETLGAEPGAGSSTFRYDPADPTPSYGGQLQSPSQGKRDNARLERRKDVLVFSTDPLTAAVDVLGHVRVEVDVMFTAVSADLFVRLCDVDPHGTSLNITDGFVRLPDGGGHVSLAMSDTAHRFLAGHRIRLQVSGGAHPYRARNYGTGEPLATATRMIVNDTTVQHTSVLVLSVL